MANRDDTKKYIAALRSNKGFAAGVGILLPAFSSFSMYCPPLLGSFGAALTSGIAAATLLSVNHYHFPLSARKSKGFPPLVRRAIWAFSLALLMLLFYLVLLQMTTVVSPPVGGEEARFQIGFGKWEPFLTDEGKEVKRISPNSTTQDWMLDDGLFRPGGPEVIWKPWAIYFAGALTLISFILTFVLWTLGWALLAKQKSLSS